jgi:hypothetical protein
MLRSQALLSRTLQGSSDGGEDVRAGIVVGTAYLTIDEALIEAGKTQRRPGLHVDGIGPDGSSGGWGGGGGGWGTNGMIVAASVAGCNVYTGEFQGWPGANGDCSHLAAQCHDEPQPGIDDLLPEGWEPDPFA